MRAYAAKAALFALLGLVSLSPLSAADSDTKLSDRVQELERLVRMQQKMLENRETTSVTKKDDLTQRIEELENVVKSQNEQLMLQNISYLDEAPKKKSSNELKVYYKDAIRFDTADKRFRFKFGGRIQQDWGWSAVDDYSDYADFDGGSGLGDAVEDGVQHRRARIYISGNLYTNVIFKWQYDFANGNPSTKDAYMGLTKLPILGTFRAGHFKEFFGLEELTSSKYDTFMEQSEATEAFAPSRNPGIGFNNAHFDERFTWGLGLFREAGDASVNDDDGYNVTGRVTGLPLYWDDGRKLVHLGVAASWRNPNDNTRRFRSRPNFRHSNRYVDTGSIGPASDTTDLGPAGGGVVGISERHGAVDNELRLGTELAWVWGSASIQAEWMASWLDRREDNNAVANDAGLRDDLFFHGGYVQFSYFLTGEHRRYKKATGHFDRVKPNKNFWDGETGLGAFELKGRFSFIDLDDGDNLEDDNPIEGEYIHGGREWSYQAGVNWYLNSHTKIMLDWTHTEWDRGGPTYDAGAVDTFPRNLDGQIDAFSLRFHVDW